MIRGKGATKEGKVGRSLLPQPGEDEPLHALITGYTPETVKKAVDKVSECEWWVHTSALAECCVPVTLYVADELCIGTSLELSTIHT